MTKRQENALKTRQKLLDVAHNLIKTKGFYKLSVEDITKDISDYVLNINF